MMLPLLYLCHMTSILRLPSGVLCEVVLSLILDVSKGWSAVELCTEYRKREIRFPHILTSKQMENVQISVVKFQFISKCLDFSF